MNRNKYPMPALTEQQRDKAIAFNLRRIASLQNAIEVFDPLDDVDRESAINDWQFEILNHQITLAALTAETSLRHEHLYTAPPVPVLKPICLPEVEKWRSVDAVRAQNGYRILVETSLSNDGYEVKSHNGVSSEE